MGTYTEKWWLHPDEECNSADLVEALHGAILTDLLPITTEKRKTIAGIVSRSTQNSLFEIWSCLLSCRRLHYIFLIAFQTTEQYRVEYDSRRGKEYSRFHGYSYDGIWAVALAIQRVASRITHYRRNQTMSDFRYRDELWEKLFLEALRNTSFEGVTVSISVKGKLIFSTRLYNLTINTIGYIYIP